MSQYTSQFPDIPVDPALKAYFEEFYKTSDTPEAHEKYAESFTEDATLVMASKTVKGRSGTGGLESLPLNARFGAMTPLSTCSTVQRTIADNAMASL